MSETILHASCVAIGGRAVLVAGRSGSGKSDLCLRLIDRGADLVSDDYTALTERGGRLFAAAPERIAGLLEIRGVGIVECPPSRDVPVCLLADLDGTVERLPEPGVREICGVAIPALALAALEASAPIKLERALLRFGLILP